MSARELAPPPLAAASPRLSPVAIFLGCMAVVYAARVAEYLLKSDGIVDASGHVLGRDYINIWGAARLTLEGNAAILWDLDRYVVELERLFGRTVRFHNWSYPPHYVPWIVAFGLLPYGWSFAAWMISTFALHAAAVLPEIRRRSGVLLALILAPSTYMNLFLGQNGFLSAALLLGGLRLLDRHPWLSGVLFGLLTFKPQLGVLVPVALLAAGAWRTIAAAAATTALCVGASLALFGAEAWRMYFAATAPYQTMLLETERHLTHFLLATPFAAVRNLGGGNALAYAVNGLTAIVALACVAWAWRQPAPRALQHAVLVCATFFVMPYAMSYDLAVVSLAVVTVWLALPPARLTLAIKALLMAVWMLPLLNHLLSEARLPVAPFVLASFLALLLRLVREQRRGGLEAGCGDRRKLF